MSNLKATELRIGNYVSCKMGEYPVCQILDDLVMLKIYDDRDSSMFYDQVQPIPLTEKWLEDFGFTDYQKSDDPEHLNEYGQDWHKIYLAPDERTYLHNERDEGWRASFQSAMYDESTGLTAFSEQIQFVHQLQNLYYALTTQELTSKTQGR